ncbi:signal recognition particle protein [Candidatus Hydrogenosomobacter endosymbioticus]|uniref:signal-recognition-particle GTPase n=1 Tax=Candidatus Hydrogenosomobacter endosymbioticus TaxID=2558174 RepID=A0ABM7V8R0_9PROT|nr:signal recognition particle protein [Candidatus Hydrogenosomobacter endosymbioticus]BDB96152.1 hypothetical protein HYD_2850 [Candidatus Hydrogenosomobacter endosymbioticus]
MFDSLGKKLGDIFSKVRNKGALTEADIDSAMREIRVALLEADVAISVAKEFIESAKEKALGMKIIKSVNPAQMVVKIVHDQLIKTMTHDESSFRVKNSRSGDPAVIMMVGLQGSGKTTMSAKLAFFLKKNYGKKSMMASVDVYRPAAMEQLEVLGAQIGVDVFQSESGASPVGIAKIALEKARGGAYDILIVDTAGRMQVNEGLMEEARSLNKALSPVETLFVADSLSGQDIISTANAFNDSVGLTGVCLSRVDSDGRGGAALSVRAVTGKPIKLLGVGERPDQVEEFSPSRIADRILDMGDIVGLVETAAEAASKEDQIKEFSSMQKGVFTLDDLAKKILQIEKIGGIKGLLGSLPGARRIKEKIGDRIENASFKSQLAIISSMTKKERKFPETLNASRKIRIAAGSGTSVQEINRLLKQFQAMKKAMKQVGKIGREIELAPESKREMMIKKFRRGV